MERVDGSTSSHQRASGVPRAEDSGGSGLPGGSWSVVALVVVASLMLGGLTSLAQTVLPSSFSPVANSASGWTALTALLVGAARPSTRVGAVLGAVSFVSLVLGYTAVSTARGYYFSPVFWSLIGVLAGPFVGVASAWLRTTRWRKMSGAGLLAGIAVGEGIYGLTVVRATTGWLYWTAAIVVGVAVMGVAVARVRQPKPVLVGLGVLVVVVATFNLGYRSLG